MKKTDTSIRKTVFWAFFISLLPVSILGLNDTPGHDRDIPTALVSVKPIEVKVHAMGKLEPADAEVISSSLPGDSGKIIWIIQDGSKVKKGDILVRFDSENFKEQVQQLKARVSTQEAVVEALEQALQWEKSQSERLVHTAQYELKIARMELGQMKQGEGPMELARRLEVLNRARQKYANLKGYLQDLRKLLSSGYVDEVEVTKTEMELKTALLEMEMADKKYQSFKKYILPAKLEKRKAEVERKIHGLEEMKRTGGFKIGKAKARLKEGRKRLEHLREKLTSASKFLDATVIRAPKEGTVILAEKYFNGKRRKPRVGDKTWQGQPLIYLPEMDKMIVTAKVRELDLHNLSVGQRASISIDAFPEMEFKGTLKSIASMADQGEEYRYRGNMFSVVIDIDGFDDRLRPGMTARVSIYGDRKEKALVIPMAALFGSRKNYFCYVKNQGAWRPIPVETGLFGTNYVEIVKGVDKDDLVALVGPSH